MRQQAIAFVRNPPPHTSLGLYKVVPPLDNLKFAIVSCIPAGGGFMSNGRCVVNDIQYYKPQACITLPDPRDKDSLWAPNLAKEKHDSRDAISGLNWLMEIAVNWRDVSNDREIFPDRPLLENILQAMRTKIKEFAARNQGR